MSRSNGEFAAERLVDDAVMGTGSVDSQQLVFPFDSSVMDCGSSAAPEIIARASRKKRVFFMFSPCLFLSVFQVCHV